MAKNYYISSFFWSTLQKILSAILGFVSVPLLLGYYGKAEYGILAIATACNGYMHLLDLGMNIGAIKFYSQWRREGKNELINHVARTNITFYLIIACINILGLLFLALFGEHFFSVTHDQFVQLRWCLFTLCIFSPLAWVTTAFNQLLVSDKRIDYTMKVQCVQTLFKAALIFIAIYGGMSLSVYFFFLTLILSLLLFPYAYKCLALNLINSIKPAKYWSEFRVVLTFSLSIFALSLFQVTATQSRPIILSIFSNNGAEVVADFRILEVIPSLIIMIGGQFAAIFLPQASSLVASKDQIGIEKFAYKWTALTSILSNILCFPFVLCASEVLSAYVGSEYKYLSNWLVLWCITVLSYIHTTPGNSLVLAYGKTKVMVVVTAISCIFSLVLNAFLCQFFNVGSAIIAYFIHVVITTSLYYVYYYNRLMGLSRKKMFFCFATPTFYAILSSLIVYYLPLHMFFIDNIRLNYILICIIKSLVWIILYVGMLLLFRVIDIKIIKSLIKK